MRVPARPAWLLLPVFAGLFAVGPPAAAHPGGLDASGCHTNRKTGDCHCHRTAGTPAASVPNSGLTAPAPSGVVKKSRIGICHAPGTPYESVEACLSSGGRLPGLRLELEMNAAGVADSERT